MVFRVGSNHTGFGSGWFTSGKIHGWPVVLRAGKCAHFHTDFGAGLFIWPLSHEPGPAHVAAGKSRRGGPTAWF